MDRGAWWAAVHGAAKSRIWLSDFTFTFHFHALEKEMATYSSVLAWRIPGMEEPCGLPSMGSHRVGHDWSNLAAAFAGNSDFSLITSTIKADCKDLCVSHVVLVVKRHRFDPWTRKIPWRRAWQPTLVFLPGKSHWQRVLAGYSPWAHRRVCPWSNSAQLLFLPLHHASPGVSFSFWAWPCSVTSHSQQLAHSSHHFLAPVAAFLALLLASAAHILYILCIQIHPESNWLLCLITLIFFWYSGHHKLRPLRGPYQICCEFGAHGWSKQVQTEQPAHMQWCAGVASYWSPRADCETFRNLMSPVVKQSMVWNRPGLEYLHMDISKG